ncbi:MAG: hypothetical protein HY758_10200 [Nitrospirae bacterium]|nr:hypothetical protein [Nitrospirota bacterium]
MPLIKQRKEKLRFQVGIDFGTSSTKIAYAQLGVRGKRVRPVLFDHNLPHYPPFALPSVAAFDQNGKLQMGIEAARYLSDKSWDTGFRRIKVVVAGKYDDSFYDEVTCELYQKYLLRSGMDHIEPEHFTVLYLAHAIHCARTAIMNKFPSSDIDIAFNICSPIDHIQNNKFKPVFERIVAAAENVESQWRDGGRLESLLDAVVLKYNETLYRPHDEATRVFVIPESVAEIASYLVSLQARNGLHAVLDFGAGTTDLSIFNLYGIETDETTTYWYAARNLPRGAQRIELIIKRYIQRDGIVVSDKDISHALNNLKKFDGEIIRDIRHELFELWEETLPVWKEAYVHNPYQPEWFENKVHIFTCGGGAKIPSINEIFRQSWISGKVMYGSKFHPIKTLPMPEDYDSVNNRAPFDRLSVAYGLTIPQPVLGKYILPRDCPVHHQPDRPSSGTRIMIKRCSCGSPAVPGENKCINCM